MKYIGLIVLVLATSFLTAILSHKFGDNNPPESGHALTKSEKTSKKTTHTSNVDDKLLQSLKNDLYEIKSLLQKNVPDELTSLERDIDEISTNDLNAKDLQIIIDLIKSTHNLLLSQPQVEAKKNIESIITNQTNVIETVKDMQWEQTPMHILDLSNIEDLSEIIYKSEKEILTRLMTDFPLQVSLLSLNLEKTAKEWSYKVKANWELLMNKENGGGVFYLHLSAEDFIKNRNNYTVKKFLTDISGKTQIILYHPTWASFIDLFQKSSNSNAFEKYDKMIRLDIGNNFLQLKGCLSPKLRLSFLRSTRFNTR